jgi:hypothetical protein
LRGFVATDHLIIAGIRPFKGRPHASLPVTASCRIASHRSHGISASNSRCVDRSRAKSHQKRLPTNDSQAIAASRCGLNSCRTNRANRPAFQPHEPDSRTSNFLQQFFPARNRVVDHLQGVIVQRAASQSPVRESITRICNHRRLMPSCLPNSLDLTPIEVIWGIIRAKPIWAPMTTRPPRRQLTGSKKLEMSGEDPRFLFESSKVHRCQVTEPAFPSWHPLSVRN